MTKFTFFGLKIPSLTLCCHLVPYLLEFYVGGPHVCRSEGHRQHRQIFQVHQLQLHGDLLSILRDHDSIHLQLEKLVFEDSLVHLVRVLQVWSLASLVVHYSQTALTGAVQAIQHPRDVESPRLRLAQCGKHAVLPLQGLHAARPLQQQVVLERPPRALLDLLLLLLGLDARRKPVRRVGLVLVPAPVEDFPEGQAGGAPGGLLVKELGQAVVHHQPPHQGRARRLRGLVQVAELEKRGTDSKILN
mmetsp:Transcript_6372/g.9680  ORF Transcript_6372/g.9680 Transcript_6372/m.9680 type:complete len:246 (-) Transcript_6372:419-1156(-)